MSKTSVFVRPDNTWQGALVHSDYCQDMGDDIGAEQWRLVGRIQEKALLLWEKWGTHPSQLRSVPMMFRTNSRKFECGGNVYILEVFFAPKQIIWTLYKRGEIGNRWSDGYQYQCVRDTATNRTTLIKHGPDKVTRNVAQRLIDQFALA